MFIFLLFFDRSLYLLPVRRHSDEKDEYRVAENFIQILTYMNRIDIGWASETPLLQYVNGGAVVRKEDRTGNVE